MSFRRLGAVLTLLAIIALVLPQGCVKELKTPASSPGLDTLPHYQAGVYSFDTKAAVADALRQKEDAEKRKEEITAEVKEKVKSPLGKTFDPWVSPEIRTPDDLPPALRPLPKDKFGYPDWTASFIAGLVKPRSDLESAETEDAGEGVLDLDVVFRINDRLMFDVLFPHKTHTQLLSCSNCHPSIFKEKKGANQFTMYDVWNGQYCGRCHGKVAFQPKGYENCRRCHKVPKTSLEGVAPF
ncbi:MAG: cytochrome c3 family protein [Thermodesulfobacteriota bacterium]